MTTALRKKIGRMTPEQEILLNRLVMGGVSGIVCYLVGLNIGVSMAFLVYMLCNAALFVMQRAKIWRDEQRWFAAIILDVAMAVTTMLIEPEGMAWAYPVMLWMILGNGFRFGLKWLAIASVMSAVGFGSIFMLTGYWQNNQILGSSLVLALLIIPAYCSTLIRKLSKAKDDAEAASRAKSYFLASVSHELRTPLNAIIGYGNHLKGEKLPRNQHDMVDASVLAGEHLLHLIDQLMHISKSDVGPVKYAKSDFVPTDILSEVRGIMQVRASEKGISLQVQAAPLSDQCVHGPVETIRNLLINLASNAIKFTEAGSVSISVSPTGDDKDAYLDIVVADTGIGIASDALDRIFQPFQQADETVSNRFGGTGLGLAICKQLVDQVGGSIRVESALGKGSSFFVRVPVEQASTIDQHAKQPTSNEVIKIISLGDFSADMLASAQSADNFSIYHVKCHNLDELENAVSNCDLDQFHVALVDERLASAAGPENGIWSKFVDQKIAPVLVQHDGEVDIEDVSLRAAFASVIPATPDFDTVRSAVRIGCSFANNLAVPEPEAPENSVFAERYVLVADDNRTNRNILATILEAAGHRIKMVADGDEALDALEEEKFDVLLLDVNMPRLGGIEMCKMWRQIEGGRARMPIIGVTADATEETQKNCIDAGMDIRVTKPVDANALLKLIDDMCGGTPSEIPARANLSDPLNKVHLITQADIISCPSIDPEQIEYLQSIGNADFLGEMIAGFLEDIDETEPQFRQSTELVDVAQFRFCAHAFKSSANNIGAKRLANICAELETITEPDFQDNRFEHLAKVEEELKNATAELELIASGAPDCVRQAG